MRLVFIVIGNSRRNNYLNGITIKSGGGGASGTDTSNILVAEYLANNGHEVVYCSEKLEPALEEKLKLQGINQPAGEKVNGVRYTDLELTGIENRTFDILVSNLWYHDYEIFPAKITRGLIYWSHMQWIYGMGEITSYVNNNNLKLGLVHISRWEKEMNSNVANTLIKNTNHCETIIIPNPITDDILVKVKNKNLAKKPGKFIFHASWPRGGEVAFDLVNKLDIPNKEFHAFDYLMVIGDHKDSFFYRHEAVDKETLFTHLAECEYFIYPLYTPYQDVHKDTFACVVAEAIALGAVPITYPLGALPENFSEFCAWADTPEGVNIIEMQKESLSKDLEGKFNTSKYLLKKYLELEETGNLKTHVQNKGFDFILDNFSVAKVGKIWNEYLKRF